MTYLPTLLLQVVVPEASDLAISYYRVGNILWILGWLWTLSIPLIFLLTGWSLKLGSFAKKRGKNLFFSTAIYLVGFIAFYALLSLPLDFARGYLVEHFYDLSTQTIAKWFLNFGKETLITVLIAAAFGWIFYWFIKKSSKLWWLFSGLAMIPIFLFLTFVTPIWIDPLFNNFGPMKNKELEKEILALTCKGGIGDAKIFEVDKSADTKMGNAYVNGIGNTKRIVLWDTIIDTKHPEKTLFVVAHEMGHYVLHHIWMLLGYYIAIVFIILYLTNKSSLYILSRYQKRLKFKNLYDVASLPLLFILINFFFFLQLPLFNAFSRHLETEADRFAIEITENNEAGAATFVDFATSYPINPRPGIIYEIWRGNHPSLADRIDFCNNYTPWKTGEPLKYANHFHSDCR